MKYKVTTTATAVWHIYVDADSVEEAKTKVFEGEYDSKFDMPDDYINEEVHEVSEVK